MDAVEPRFPPTSARPVVFTITAIFNNYKLLFHERLGHMVFNFHSGRCLSVCRGCNLWSGSGTGTGGFLAWRRAAADRAFPSSPSWSHPPAAAPPLLLHCYVSWPLWRGNTLYKRRCNLLKKKGGGLTFVLNSDFRDGRDANLPL